MEIFLIALSVFVIIYPILRFCFFRIHLLLKIRNCCKKNNYDFGITNFFSLFFRTNSPCNHIYIKTTKCIYAIKLFGFFSKKKYLCFQGNGEYAVKDISFSILSSVAFKKEYKTKKLKSCDFRKYLPEREESFSIKNCYLLSPNLNKGMKISCVRKNQMKEIISGDQIPDGYFYTLKGLIRELNYSNNK